MYLNLEVRTSTSNTIRSNCAVSLGGTHRSVHRTPESVDIRPIVDIHPVDFHPVVLLIDLI